jgi:hypothetical protein
MIIPDFLLALICFVGGVIGIVWMEVQKCTNKAK